MIIATQNQLVSEWRDLWKWWSVRIAALIAIAPELYESVPEMKEWISPHLLHHIMGILAMLVIISRITNQTKGN